MDIVQITSELAPIAKVGGLGDMVYGLSKALLKNGHRVQVVLPKYDQIDLTKIEELQKLSSPLLVQVGAGSIATTIWQGKLDGLNLFLLEPSNSFFLRKKIYGDWDDADRFLYFCKAASLFLLKTASRETIVHLHDWPTGPTALFLEQKMATILSIHNMQHQGRCSRHQLDQVSISPSISTLRDPHPFGGYNLLRGSLAIATRLVAVSPTYSTEIQTPEGGWGLDGDLRSYRSKLSGIVNGIDPDYWNPATDPLLIDRYTTQTYLEGKKQNKKRAKELCKLAPNPDKPLVVSITRLVDQKGPHLIRYGIERTVALGGQYALLGSGQTPEMGDSFSRLASKNVSIRLDYDESLAHLLYAAADLFFMPSLFEPCGLSQLIAMRYGTIPVVRATGGLKDTIFDPIHSSHPNGFTFDFPDQMGVDWGLLRGIELYNSPTWHTLIESAMGRDHSWKESALQYAQVYQGALNYRQGLS